MQSLRSGTNHAEEDCARQVLDAVPVLMSVIRGQMRKHRSGLTIPQFRTLYFVSTGTGRSLSDVADFIGLSLPAMSRLVDGLVEKRLMVRRTCDDDRRHVRLSLTGRGEATLREARQLAQNHLLETMRMLTCAQRSTVMHVMTLLKDLFAPDLPAAFAADAQPQEMAS